MSYYKELDLDDNLNNDELLESFEKKRLKKNTTQNLKYISNSNSATNDQSEEHIYENESSSMDLGPENDVLDDVNMSDVSSNQESEKEVESNNHPLLENSSDFSLFENFSEEESEKDKESPLLFKDSRLNVRDFSLLFNATVDKLGVPEDKRDLILDLIRFALPTLNELPASYYMIKKTIPKPDISIFLLCKICNHEISSSRYSDTEEERTRFKKSKRIKKCSNEECSSNRMGLKSRSFVKVFSLNIFSQFKLIIENNEKCIKNHIGK